MYIDQTSAAESLVTQMGAIKAGVRLVSFAEKDDPNALDHALGSSNAKGLIFSPSTQISEAVSRKDLVQGLMPELEKMYPGDDLALKKYPKLEHVVQTGHSAIRGVNQWKDIAVYTTPSQSTHSIPENSADDVCLVALKDGKEVNSMTNKDLVATANFQMDNYYRHSDGNPIFMSCGLETPFGLSAFLGCSSNMKKLFIPGSYNMSSMLRSLPRQQSHFVIVDEDLFGLEVPPASAAEYEEICAEVTHALVAGKSTKTNLFKNATAKAIDPFKCNAA